MKSRFKQFGLTLVEVMVSLTVIVVLVAISLTIIPGVQKKIKIQKTRQTIQLLNAALEEYYDFWREFPLIDKNISNDFVDDTYTSAKLLTDLNGSIVAGTNDDTYASIQGLYLCLYRTPKCRDTISKINNSSINSEGLNGQFLRLDINGKEYDLFRIEDEWKLPLRYLYTKGEDSFPLIESAGPDKDFATTEDNITNRN